MTQNTREWSQKINPSRAKQDDIAEQFPNIPPAMEMFDALFGANPELDLKIAQQAQKIKQSAKAIADAANDDK